MVKNDIVSALCEKGYYKDQASEVVDDVFQIIRDALVQGDSVQIRGFGTFGVKIHKGRNSLDISTGEKRVSNDCRVPMFKASDSLKGAVRASESADE
ncbi:HU family DNA-binding protein [uncultured Reyranella sp.]|jgi:nucleoid DNA-binding protein|uniref:HU family DNA-binding protein n=1 Tax=uncultured Reyranella sp. TaxID=735512 RepID=UPI00216BBF41|nr:HU family DNA-binding protein [uncultured Reyranella sp.]MCI9433403.1 integration host factor subunit beta [Oscillospiraceae bacterium]